MRQISEPLYDALLQWKRHQDETVLPLAVGTVAAEAITPAEQRALVLAGPAGRLWDEIEAERQRTQAA